EITGGIQLQKVRIGNTDLGKMQTPRDTQGHFERGTLMIVRPPEAVMPGETAELNIEWKFKVPQQGAGGRMGHSKDNLLYLRYWAVFSFKKYALGILTWVRCKHQEIPRDILKEEH